MNKIIGLSTFFLLIVLITGCSRSVEQEKIDELRIVLQQVDTALNLDMDLFKDRAEVIRDDLNFIKSNISEEVSLEFGNQMGKYKNLKKIYEKQYNRHKDLTKLRGELAEQLDDLESDYMNYKMSKEQFKSFYRTERNDIEQLLRDAQDLNKTLYEVEPDYIRLSKFAETTIDELSAE